MTPNDFLALREMLKTESGLVLTEDKQYLLESRLSPLVKKHGFTSVQDLVQKWRRGADKALQSRIVEAMTINESFFFRDKSPFDNFENHMLKDLIERNKTSRHIRIWSAAASTGQEAYSLAMILKEYATELQGWKIEIIGTDLCSDALEKAKTGIYSQFEVQRGMPVKYLVKNFKQIGTMWQINEPLRSMVQFRQFNLMNNFSLFGRFDIIFLRNVLIYFDKETKTDILQRMEKQVNKQCFLVLGASETLVGLNEAFKPVDGVRGLYKIDTQAAQQQLNKSNLTPASQTVTAGRSLLKQTS